jgi:hypothetical protein
MATAAAKTKPAEAAPVTPAKSPEIQPSAVQVEASQFDRRVLIRMPPETVSDDLRSSQIWRKVQAVPHKALRQLDGLLILAHDESWYARALVTHATNKEASIIIEKVGTFKAIQDQLYSDDTYRVHFESGAYIVRRVSDGVKMESAGYSSEQLAIRAIGNLYPQAVNH